MKDYQKFAAEINRLYPTMYSASATHLGICVYLIKQCDPYRAAAFIEGCIIFKNKKFEVIPLPGDGVIIIR